jgi:hypothetical protein
MDFIFNSQYKSPKALAIGLDSYRLELALAVFIREIPARPQAKVKSAQYAKDSESRITRQTTAQVLAVGLAKPGAGRYFSAEWADAPTEAGAE